jgi:hypothetical protein
MGVGNLCRLGTLRSASANRSLEVAHFVVLSFTAANTDLGQGFWPDVLCSSVFTRVQP